MESIFDTMIEDESVPVSEAGGAANFVKEEYYNPITFMGKELPQFKLKKGMNYIDILPFELGTDVLAQAYPKRVKDSVWYDIPVDVHMRRKQGNIERNILSRASLGLGNDPFQEEQAFNFDKAKDAKGDKDKTSPFWKKAISLYPQGRSLYLVMVYELNEDGTVNPEKRSLHYYAPAWRTFGDLLKKKKETKAKLGENINYAHPETGVTICINGEDKTFPGSNGESVKFIGFDNIEVTKRLKPYAMDIYKKMPKLDTFLKVPTTEEMEVALFGAPRAEQAPADEDTGLDFTKETTDTVAAEVKEETTTTEADDPTLALDADFVF